jgi:hypothetical protein
MQLKVKNVPAFMVSPYRLEQFRFGRGFEK